VNLLLDTHTVLWALSDPSELSPRAREVIIDGRNPVLVSAASVWEIAIKRQLGKLRCPDDLLEQLAVHRFATLPMSALHAWTAGHLEPIHHDPFDRMLVAQARIEQLTIVTRDEHIPGYRVAVVEA
jgi:PIN domain nuclease of toxin-antitoxin system